MTPAHAAWLRKLRDEGPQGAPRPYSATIRRIWWDGLIDRRDGSAFHITPDGLAALAKHERAVKAKGE